MAKPGQRRFHQRTINETYREQRVLGDNDVTARARVNERLLDIYEEVPTQAEMDAAAAHFEATHVPEVTVAAVFDVGGRGHGTDLVPREPMARRLSASTIAELAAREDIATDLDVACPFCGSEPQQSCIENGVPHPTHRGRRILIQDILDARVRQK